MEADFNCVNKIIYGNRMLTNVRKFGLMPDEIFSERNRTAEEGSLTKVLFYDITRQSRLVAGISSVDADNCYDRVALLRWCFAPSGSQKRLVERC